MKYVLLKILNYFFKKYHRYFDKFLFHEIEEGKGNQYLELLWKFYEKNENYAKAAKVLCDLANKKGRFVIYIMLENIEDLCIHIKKMGFF